MNAPTTHRDAVVAERVCGACGAAIAPDAVACPRCAAAAPRNVTPARRTAASNGRWNDQPLAMLAMLFLGFGPFAIPWLWRGKAFDPAAKGVLSIVVTVYFAALCLAVWWSISTLIALVRNG